MRLEYKGCREQRITVKHHKISIDDTEFEIPSDFLGLLESLKEQTPGFGATVVYDSKLAKSLEECGLVRKNARGSYNHTSKLMNNYKKIREFIEQIIFY